MKHDSKRDLHSRSHHKVEHHHLGHKVEYHHDNDLHHDHHEMAHGHRDRHFHDMHKHGGHKEEVMGGRHGSMSISQAERELKTHSVGRMAKQHRQKEATGMRDDTVYGKMPPRPGRIDS